MVHQPALHYSQYNLKVLFADAILNVGDYLTVSKEKEDQNIVSGNMYIVFKDMVPHVFENICTSYKSFKRLQ